MFKNLVIAAVLSIAVIEMNGVIAQEPTRPATTPDQGRGGRDQTRGGGRPESFFPTPDPTVSLLKTPEVQRELKVEADKAQKINAIDAEVRREMQQLTDEYNAKVQALNSQMTAIKKKAEGDALRLLSEAQRRRTEQLQLQRLGWRAFLSSQTQVREKLGLTEQQMNEMGKIYAANPRSGGGGSFGSTTPQNQNVPLQDRFQQALKEREQREAENLEKMIAILTPEQKVKWSEMTGEPFKFPAQVPTNFGTPTRSAEPAKPETEKKDQ